MSQDLVPFLHARLDEEAERRVLARHVPWDNRDDCRYDGETWPCDDLLDLASPYAGHPD
ncbi:hypothetical protein AB0P45_26640 [Streptomyces niveus]|uniref:hypothetical protein n=1 Tax=Streptomyces niveus TaxID=193462 RepID=UPI0034292AF0